MNINALRWRAGWKRLALFVFVAVMAIYFAAEPALYRAGRLLNVGRPLATPVTFCYVLGGGADLRPIVAAEIHLAGLASQILVPNPPVIEGNVCNAYSEKDLIISVLRQEGVPEKAIVVLDGNPDSTQLEAVALAQFLQPHEKVKVAVVTHDFHTRRARRLINREFRAAGIATHVELSMVSVPTDEFGPENWWKFESGLRQYLFEFAKTLRDLVVP